MKMLKLMGKAKRIREKTSDAFYHQTGISYVTRQLDIYLRIARVFRPFDTQSYRMMQQCEPISGEIWREMGGCKLHES